MLWILWDIVVPLTIAFLIGLLTGWLLWRWRRARISAQKLNVIQRNSSRYQSESERLRSRLADVRDGATERLSGQSARPFTASEPPATGARHGSSGPTGAAREQGAVVASGDLPQTASGRGKTAGVSDTSRAAGEGWHASRSDSRRDEQFEQLREQLATANERVQQLEAQDAPAGIRPASLDVEELMGQLETRERMIDTLRRSLAQFGDSEDLTLMNAELAARERKIDALENMLEARIKKD